MQIETLSPPIHEQPIDIFRDKLKRAIKKPRTPCREAHRAALARASPESSRPAPRALAPASRFFIADFSLGYNMSIRGT
jgi:hypothetical protein